MTNNPKFRNSVTANEVRSEQGDISKFSNSLAGFTLIEALTTIVIIGILASLSIYTYASVSARSRDSRRKSDLTAISLGFQARYDAKTCSNSTDLGYYPGRELGWGPNSRWQPVIALKTITNDDCGSFSEYLSLIPTDPKSSGGLWPYRFDLSNQNGVIGKHYRLTVKLEKNPNSNESTNLARAVKLWNNSFGGVVNTLPTGYNYIIGN